MATDSGPRPGCLPRRGGSSCLADQRASRCLAATAVVPTRGAGEAGRGVSATRGAARVADRHRERVGGVVGRRRLGQPEQRRHHPLDLALVGRARAADGLLHGLRRVVEAGHAALGGGEHRDAARLADAQRRAHVLAEEEVLERHRLRLVPVDQLAPATRGSSARRSSGRQVGRGLDHARRRARPSGRPIVRTTPNPVFAAPGSMPITIMPLDSRSPPGCPPGAS